MLLLATGFFLAGFHLAMAASELRTYGEEKLV